MSLAERREAALVVSLAVRLVLAVPDQDNVPRQPRARHARYFSSSSFFFRHCRTSIVLALHSHLTGEKQRGSKEKRRRRNKHTARGRDGPRRAGALARAAARGGARRVIVAGVVRIRAAVPVLLPRLEPAHVDQLLAVLEGLLDLVVRVLRRVETTRASRVSEWVAKVAKSSDAPRHTT